MLPEREALYIRVESWWYNSPGLTISSHLKPRLREKLGETWLGRSREESQTDHQQKPFVKHFSHINTNIHAAFFAQFWLKDIFHHTFIFHSRLLRCFAADLSHSCFYFHFPTAAYFAPVMDRRPVQGVFLPLPSWPLEYPPRPPLTLKQKMDRGSFAQIFRSLSLSNPPPSLFFCLVLAPSPHTSPARSLESAKQRCFENFHQAARFGLSCLLIALTESQRLNWDLKGKKVLELKNNRITEES